MGDNVSCASCGTELDEGVQFCLRCGHPAGADAPAPSTNPAPAASPPPPSSPRLAPAEPPPPRPPPQGAPIQPAATPPPQGAPIQPAAVPQPAPANPAPPTAHDPNGLGVAVSRLAARRGSDAVFAVASVILDEGEQVEIAVHGRYQGLDGAAILTSERLLLLNSAKWKPTIDTVPVTADLSVQGLADGRAASLLITVGRVTHTVDQIRDTTIAQEFAHRLRSRAAYAGSGAQSAPASTPEPPVPAPTPEPPPPASPDQTVTLTGDDDSVPRPPRGDQPS